MGIGVRDECVVPGAGQAALHPGFSRKGSVRIGVAPRGRLHVPWSGRSRPPGGAAAAGCLPERHPASHSARQTCHGALPGRMAGSQASLRPIRAGRGGRDPCAGGAGGQFPLTFGGRFC